MRPRLSVQRWLAPNVQTTLTTVRWAMYFASLLTGERSANEIRLLGRASGTRGG